MDPVIIDQDDLWKLSGMVSDIKRHLKVHFDLDGDNQPWHMFDDVAAEIMVLVNKE